MQDETLTRPGRVRFYRILLVMTEIRKHRSFVNWILGRRGQRLNSDCGQASHRDVLPAGTIHRIADDIRRGLRVTIAAKKKSHRQ